MSRPVCLDDVAAELLVGREEDRRLGRHLRTMRSALLDVQMMSLSAFTAALQLM